MSDAPSFFSTPHPRGIFLLRYATPWGWGAKKAGGHPTYQHQPICSFLTLFWGCPAPRGAPFTDYEITDFGFGFGIGLGRCYGFRIGLLRYVFVIMSLTFKHINSILFCLRCLLPFSLVLLTLSIRFFPPIYTFFGGHPIFHLMLVIGITNIIIEVVYSNN